MPTLNGPTRGGGASPSSATGNGSLGYTVLVLTLIWQCFFVCSGQCLPKRNTRTEILRQRRRTIASRQALGRVCGASLHPQLVGGIAECLPVSTVAYLGEIGRGEFVAIEFADNRRAHHFGALKILFQCEPALTPPLFSSLEYSATGVLAYCQHHRCKTRPRVDKPLASAQSRSL